jgi:hypothetical protein
LQAANQRRGNEKRTFSQSTKSNKECAATQRLRKASSGQVKTTKTLNAKVLSPVLLIDAAENQYRFVAERGQRLHVLVEPIDGKSIQPNTQREQSSIELSECRGIEKKNSREGDAMRVICLDTMPVDTTPAELGENRHQNTNTTVSQPTGGIADRLWPQAVLSMHGVRCTDHGASSFFGAHGQCSSGKALR